METVFQYKIPVLHPIAVHFPPALLLAAAGAGLGWMVRGTAFWRRCLTYLLGLAGLGTAFAYFTGDAMYARSEGVPIVEELVSLHQQMALYTLIVVLGAFAGVAGCSAWLGRRRRRGRDPLWMRLLVGGAALLAAGLGAWTGHIGGTMTWGVAA